MNKLINDNSVITNLLVRSLINPNNELFIGTLTIEQVKSLLDVDTNPDGWTDVFWSAFSQAQSILLGDTNNETAVI